MSNSIEKDLLADQFAVAWGTPGLLVQFSGVSHSGQRLHELALPPATAADLLRELRAVLGTHEERYGTCWSVHDAQLGAQTDRRTGLGDCGETLGEHGRGMYRLLKNLALNGYERSFKMQPGQLLTERFLLGIHRDNVAPPQVGEIIDQLGLPQAYRDSFIGALPDTRFLHFGHEGSPGGSIRKLYQEFAQPEAKNDSTSVLLYTGYKWDPADASRCSVSQYRLQRGLSVAAMLERVESLLPGQPGIASITSGLLKEASARCDAEDLLYVDVSEEGNPRASCDINMYAADLQLGQIVPVLAQAASCFGIQQEALHTCIERLPEARLGHISAGTGRDAQPFLTVYYSLPEA